MSSPDPAPDAPQNDRGSAPFARRERLSIAPSDVAAAAQRRLLVKEVAALTGVGRERLRTWERRHGFPRPQLNEARLRTYAPSELPLIVAAARLVESGFPVAEAIGTVLEHGEAGSDQANHPELASLDGAPMPAIGLAGAAAEDLVVV